MNILVLDFLRFYRVKTFILIPYNDKNLFPILSKFTTTIIISKILKISSKKAKQKSKNDIL